MREEEEEEEVGAVAWGTIRRRRTRFRPAVHKIIESGIKSHQMNHFIKKLGKGKKNKR